MKVRFKASTLVLCVLLAAGLVGIGVLLPRTVQDKRVLDTESAATPTPTANISSMLLVTPEPGSTPAPTAYLLKTGVKGDEVRNVQQRLKELGFYTGDVDGQYGPGTAEAVRLFQEQHGLTGDGIVGEGTRAALFASTAQTYQPVATPTPTPSLLKKGSSGDEVRAMQQRLRELGFYTGEVDGGFGAGTEEALRLFQRQNGLDVDGVAAAKTFAVLYSDQARQVTVTPTPDPDAMPLLVNRSHPVDQDYQPGDLVLLKNVLPSSLCTVRGDDMEGDRTAAQALAAMFQAAKQDGVTGWQISAAYRSYKYQQTLFDRKVKEYMDQGFSKSNATSAARQTVADPGTSEHHTGLAFDITVAGTSFKGTQQQKWLHKHCWDYGFIVRYQEDKEKITGYIAECWHIRYVGLPHSLTMLDKNQCLEEYLGVTD